MYGSCLLLPDQTAPRPIYLVLEAGPPMPPVGGRWPAITSSMTTLTMYGYWHLSGD
jgi:hypothetical protein